MRKPPRLAMAVEDQTLNAVLYLRISEDKNLGTEREAAGVERQGEDGRDLARRRDWNLVETYIDNDLSATSGKRRPGFERMIRLVKSGQVQVIVAWAFDRLVRNRREGVDLIELCIEHKITIALVKGMDLDMTTAMGQAMADMMLAWARLEMAQKSERQLRASQQRIEKGVAHSGGRAPFGFADSQLQIPVPNEIYMLRLAYAHVQAGGSLHSLAKAWEAAGIKSPSTGRPFTKQGIRDMLLHPRYIGIRCHYGEEIGPATWEAIIGEATFRSVGVILRDPRRKVHKGVATKHLLAGLMLCGQCAGENIVTTMRTAYRTQSNNARAYVCRDFDHLSRLAEPVESLVRERVLDILAHPDASEILLDRDKPNVDDLKVKADGIRRRRRAILALVANGDYTQAEAREHLDDLTKELADIEAQTRHVDRAPILAEAVAAADEAGPEIAARLAAVAKAWASYSLERRRAIIQLLVKVTLNKGAGGRFKAETVVIEDAI